MLLDLAEYLLTPCPRFVRQLGYLDEAQAIRRRAKLCRAAWADHLKRSRALILRAAEHCQQHRRVMLIGAGLLADVPLAELSARFAEVCLVDVVFPLSTRWQLRHFPKVRKITADVTGTALAVWKNPNVIPAPQPCSLFDEPDLDLVVSLNVLSQLPFVPERHLCRHGHKPAVLDEFARSLIRSHLADLNRCRETVALIADIELLTLDAADTVVERADTLRGVPPPSADKEWWWEIAPRPTAHPSYGYRRRVIGIADCRSNSAFRHK